MAARQAWFDGQLDLEPERLIFLDECGTNTKMARLYGRSKRGERCRAAIPHGHWKTTTLVAGLSTDGIVAPMILDGAMDGEMFSAYVKTLLVPCLMPGDIVIMDNLPAHKVSSARQAIEAMAVVNTVQQRMQSAPFAMSVDCHSGFGRRDRLWCSYARSHKPIAHIAEVLRLKQLFEQTYPHHHPYIIEPQSINYTTHGDLWDYLYDHSQEHKPDNLFLPFTLEMGSWLWVRKNPRQMLDYFGYFNPVISHRKRRVLRQHLPLFEFLTHATRCWRSWTPTPQNRDQLTSDAIELWFVDKP